MSAFKVKADLPLTTRQEIDRIQALPSGQRSAKESALLTSLAPYLVNEILERDSDDLIVQSAGTTVPTGDTGFKKGAIFIDKDATGGGRYVNIGDENSAAWKLVDESTESLDVTTYGAAGDGVTDDTAAIQATIDAVEANGGGQVFLPVGTYLISDTLTIDTSNVALIGEVAGATVIKAADGAEDIAMLIVGDGTNTCAHVRIADILFTSVNQKTSNQAIKVQKGFKIWLERIRVENQYNSIYIFNTTQVYFRDSDIRNTINHGLIVEAELGSGYDYYINNVVMDNPDISGSVTGNGIEWLGGENFVVQNCDVINFVLGLHVSPAASHQCRFGFFVNAEFDTASDNAISISSSGGDIIGLTFTNTWSGSATNYGVLINSGSGGLTQGIRFIGHKSFHNGLAGIRLAGGQDVHLADCDVIGNSQTSSGTRHGIEVADSMGDNWSIIGGKSGNGYQQGTTQSYGINTDGSHAYVNAKILGVDVVDNIDGGINLNGATGIEVLSNLGYSTVLATGASATVDDVITALQGLGLFKQS